MTTRLAWPIWCGTILAVWAGLKWPLIADPWPAGVTAALRARALTDLPPPALWPLVALAIVALSGAGARLVRALGAETCGPVETLTFAAATGLGLCGTTGALLGLTGHFTRAGLTAVLLAWALAGRAGAGEVLGALRRLARAARVAAGLAEPGPSCAAAPASAGEATAAPTTDDDPGPWAPLGFAIAALVLLVALVKAATPPWYPDALFYHLALPRLYLDAGAFVTVPQEPINAAHPGLGQVLFALPMAWGRDELTGVISWVFLALTFAGAGLLGYATGGRASGALAVAATAAVPGLAFVGAMPLADAALACYVTLAMHATVRAIGNDDAGWARVASLSAGFALATKYQALAPLGLIALALVGGFARARGLAGMLRVAVPAALLCALPFAPWGLRNQRLYACPLAPLIARPDAPAAERAVLAQYRTDWLTHGHRVPAWQVPLDATFHANPDDLAGYEGELGPLPLALAPLCLLGLRRWWALAGFLLVQGLFWTAGARELRYLLPLVPTGAALALAARPRAAAPVVVAAGALSLAWLIGYARPATDLLWLAGAETRAEYRATLSATGPLARACDALERAGARRVMFFWEDRGYLCRVPYLADHLIPGSSNHLLYDLPAEPAALRARLASLNVTHLLVNRLAWDEGTARGHDATFSAALARFLDGVRAKPLPGVGPAEGAGVEVWALQEPISGR